MASYFCVEETEDAALVRICIYNKFVKYELQF